MTATMRKIPKIPTNNPQNKTNNKNILLCSTVCSFINPTHNKRDSSSECGLQTSRFLADEGSAKHPGRLTHPASCGFYVCKQRQSGIFYHKKPVTPITGYIFTLLFTALRSRWSSRTRLLQHMKAPPKPPLRQLLLARPLCTLPFFRPLIYIR